MNIETFEKNKGMITAMNDFSIPHVDISIGHYGFEKTEKDKPFVSSQGYPTYRMHYIIDGNVTLHVNDQQYTLRKNHVYLLHPDIEIGYQSNPKNPATYYWVSFTGANVGYYLQKMGLANSNFLFVPTKQQKKLHNAFFANFKITEQEGNLKDLIYMENFMKIVQILACSSNSTPVKRTQTPKKNYVERAMEMINNNYMNPTFSIREVAKELFLHENYFSKLFKEKNKQSFNTYLSRYRIEMSITLMHQGLTSVTDIAFAVGFSDPLYFSKVFKKYSHCSPSDEIRKAQAKLLAQTQNS